MSQSDTAYEMIEALESGPLILVTTKCHFRPTCLPYFTVLFLFLSYQTFLPKRSKDISNENRLYKVECHVLVIEEERVSLELSRAVFLEREVIAGICC